jgi:serine/threonine-protein kinase
MKARIRLSGALITTVQVFVLLAAAGAVFAVTAYLSMQMVVFGSEVTVPRIVELAPEPARRALAPLELRLETVGSRHDDLVPAGQILSQEPPPESQLKRGRKVKVQVSLGPEQHLVPDLQGMTVPRASVLLRQDRLRLGQVAYAYADSPDENLVMAQDPPAGSQIEEDGRVDLLVSRGKPPRGWVMPRLEGRSLDRARRFLERQGLKVGKVRWELDPALSPGIIVRQYPPAGYSVHSDDLISLVANGTKEDSR